MAGGHIGPALGADAALEKSDPLRARKGKLPIPEQ
jgi:hypothetical protein